MTDFTAPGQLRAVVFGAPGIQSTTVVLGNVDADPDAEFAVSLRGGFVLSDTDFILQARGKRGMVEARAGRR